MIPESEISECPEFEVKSKIGNIFVNEKILEEYSVKIYKIDPYLELMFILLNMSQTWKLMKKIILTEILFLRRKDKKHYKKKLGCKFIRINTSKEGYNADYKASRAQIFISEFKNKKFKKLGGSNKKIKELEDEIKKLKLELASQITQ